MGILSVHYNKTLKLSNVCIYEISEDDMQNLEKTVYQMENYIKSKGAMPIGPLVQCTQVSVTEAGEPNIKMQLLRQANTFISKVEAPYSMQSILRCANCLFVRFYGEEYQLKFAYDKLSLISFEEDIPLTGRTFTVFTSQSDDQFSADVFMEKDHA